MIGEVEDASGTYDAPEWLLEGVDNVLRGYQQEWIAEADGKDVAHRGARQVGKDHTWAFEVALDLAYRPKRQWSILSASLSHSKDFLDDVSLHLDFLEALSKLNSVGFPKRLKDSAEQIKLDNGSFIRAFAATPKNAQGRRGNIILNELGIMPQAELIYETAEAVVRGQRNMGLDGLMRIIGNASPQGSFFHRFWEGRQSASFVKITSSWEDVFLDWLTNDLGHAVRDAQTWIDAQVAEMIERLGLAGFGQWYRCEWRAPAEGFFDVDLLLRQQYDPLDLPDAFPDLADSRVIQSIGWDPSRRVHPAGIAQALLGSDGQSVWGHNPRRMVQWEWQQQEDELDRLRRQRRTAAIVIDRQGIGDKPAADAARRFGRIVHEYAFSSPARMLLFNNLLSQLERGVAWMPASTDLQMELQSIQRTYSQTGREGIDIPESRDCHGDMAVAMALAVYGLTEGDALKGRKSRQARSKEVRQNVAQTLKKRLQGRKLRRLRSEAAPVIHLPIRHRQTTRRAA